MLHIFAPQAGSTMTSRIDIMTIGHAIVHRKSFVHEFPHKEGDSRNDSKVPNKITQNSFTE